MTAIANVQINTAPNAFDFAFVNLSGATIPAFTPVKPDATAGNQLGTGTNEGCPIIPIAAIGDPCIGMTMEPIVNGASGRVRVAGPVIPGICDGGVTAGQVVDFSSTANRSIKAHTATKAQAGIALATGADGETVPVLMTACGANNA